jgi:hypothetical protein
MYRSATTPAEQLLEAKAVRIYRVKAVHQNSVMTDKVPPLRAWDDFANQGDALRAWSIVCRHLGAACPVQGTAEPKRRRR